MNFSCKVQLRTDYQKVDGTRPILLCIILNRKVKRYSLGFSVDVKYWDEDKGLVKSNHTDSSPINLIILSRLKLVNDIMYDYTIKKKHLTFEAIESELFGIKPSCFYSFVKIELENNANTNYYRASTLRMLHAELTKMKAFKKSLTFADVDVSFLNSYEGYMRNVLKNQVNTIHKSLKFIRTFINKAIKLGLVDDYVFSKYKLRTENTKRNFLDEAELKAIEKLVFTHRDLANDAKLNQIHAAKLFLFSCYTGLRYTDVLNLTFEHIREMNGTSMIVMEMHKTKDVVSIPIIDKAKGLIDFESKSRHVFKVPANQVLNKQLKLIAKEIGVNKTLTFHCARHTFATIGLSLGIPLIVISKMLGHRDLKTTQIYAKVADNLKVEQMNKWNAM